MVSVLIVLALVFIDRGFITTSAPDLNESHLPQTEVQTVAENATRVQDEPEEVKVEEIGLAVSSRDIPADVWELCAIDEYPVDRADVRGYLKDRPPSEECTEALEIHLLDRNPFALFSHEKFSLIQIDNPLTYERIFTDPENDLERILDAISRPECRLADGPIVNWELKNSCHADSFTNYATFYHVCYVGISFAAHLSYLSDYEPLFQIDPRTKSSFWQNYLERRWVSNHCRSFNQAIRLNTENYPAQYQQLLNIGQDHDRVFIPLESQQNDENFVLYKTLLSLGARLGDEAATLEYLPQSNIQLETYYNERQPWRENWEQPKRDTQPSESQLLTALDLIASVADTDVKLDWEDLVKRVCKPDLVQGVSSHPSCQTLISDLLKKLDPTEERKIQALNQFERKAIELGLYN